MALIIRSGDGLLRRTRNLCLSSLLEAVRDQTRVVELKQVTGAGQNAIWPVTPSTSA